MSSYFTNALGGGDAEAGGLDEASFLGFFNCIVLIIYDYIVLIV
jgi:hypothetical protein